jgi:hypothetical protein
VNDHTLPDEGSPPVPRYSCITVELVDHDGNAFAILGRVQREMRREGVPASEVSQFVEEATSGDYDHLLATCLRWVDAR